ncbi:MAG: TonB-dependent receptor [Marinifilaceae bacterium]|nr:TonB-dependent receptor [Marinifilaceae bacterium]
MKKVLFSMLMLLIVGLQGVWAQQKTVSGVVSSADDGLPIPGVSIVIKGTTIGTATDLDGKFSLSVNKGDEVLIFSFVGMVSQEHKVADMKPNMAITMKSESIGVNEVIITAYGTTKKSSFTGSATQVNADDISKTPVVSVDQALSGSTAGVQVSGTSGQPGSSPSIRIRGIGSINSSNEPLYVIDGVAVLNDNLSSSSSAELGVLSTLNPSDIASMTVLKDAAAAALYGSRAANGVILITTKKGKKGKTKFTFKSEFGFSDFAVKTAELASPEETYDYKYESIRNFFEIVNGLDTESAKSKAESNMKALFPSYDPTRPDSDYDWEDALFRIGKVQDHQFSASGGGEKTKFFASLAYNKTDGVTIGSDFERASGRLNLDHKANDLIEFGFNTNLTYIEQNTVPSDGAYKKNPWYSTRGFLNQLIPIKDSNGDYSIIPNKNPNPIAEESLNIQNTRVWKNTNQGSFTLNLMEGLKFKSTNSMDLTQTYGHRYWSPKSQDGESMDGYANEKVKKRLKLVSTNIFTYNTRIKDVHNIDILAGYEVEKLTDHQISGESKGLPTEDKVRMDVAAIPLSNSSYKDSDRMQSILSRLNYNYDNKYYFGLSYRTDASSRLGSDNRWGHFYSVSGSWRITQEDFMKQFDFINDMKLRASYGVNGTLPSSWVGSRGLYSYAESYNAEAGQVYYQVDNDKLKWEKNKNFNIGFDAKIMDKFNVEFDYFHKKTVDLLLPVPTTRATGYTKYLDNVGEMTNKGFELTLTSYNITKDDFTWTTSLNLTHFKNTVDKLEGGDNVSTFPFILREGESYTSMYLRDWAGVNPETGIGEWYILDENEKRVDLDDDGKADTTSDSRLAGKKIVGNAEPKLSGSIRNSFTYKGIDLSFMFTFKIGGDAYLYNANSLWDDGADLNRPVLKSNLDYWKQKGDVTDNPRLIYSAPDHGNYNSSRRIMDASYLRLKNISLGYSLPSDICKKIKMDNIRFYATAVNLLTFSKMDDFDPETTARGVIYDNWNFPPLKTYTFGIQVNF